MKNVGLIALMIVVVASYYGCATNFYLKKDRKIETVTLTIEFDPKIDESYVAAMKFNIEQFLTERDQETHKIAVTYTDQSPADLTLKVLKVRSPSQVLQVTALVVSFGTLGFTVSNPSIGQYVWPLIYMHTVYNYTKCSFTVSPELANFPKKWQLVVFKTERRLNNRESELRQHIRAFDAHLGLFLDDFEKQYVKRNGL